MLGPMLQAHYRRGMNCVSRDGYLRSGRRYIRNPIRSIVETTTTVYHPFRQPYFSNDKHALFERKARSQ